MFFTCFLFLLYSYIIPLNCLHLTVLHDMSDKSLRVEVCSLSFRLTHSWNMPSFELGDLWLKTFCLFFIYRDPKGRLFWRIVFASAVNWAPEPTWDCLVPRRVTIRHRILRLSLSTLLLAHGSISNFLQPYRCNTWRQPCPSRLLPVLSSSWFGLLRSSESTPLLRYFLQQEGPSQQHCSTILLEAVIFRNCL